MDVVGYRGFGLQILFDYFFSSGCLRVGLRFIRHVCMVFLSAQGVDGVWFWSGLWWEKEMEEMWCTVLGWKWCVWFRDGGYCAEPPFEVVVGHRIWSYMNTGIVLSILYFVVLSRYYTPDICISFSRLLPYPISAPKPATLTPTTPSPSPSTPSNSSQSPPYSPRPPTAPSQSRLSHAPTNRPQSRLR